MVRVEVAASLRASSLSPQTWLMSRFYGWEIGSGSCWEEQRLTANGDESHVVGDLVRVSDWLWGMGTPWLGNPSEVEKLFEGAARDKGRQSACSWVGPRQLTHSHSQAPARLLTSWGFCLAHSFMGAYPGGDHACLALWPVLPCREAPQTLRMDFILTETTRVLVRHCFEDTMAATHTHYQCLRVQIILNIELSILTRAWANDQSWLNGVFFFFPFRKNIQVRLKKRQKPGGRGGSCLLRAKHWLTLTLWDRESMAQKVSVTGQRSHSHRLNDFRVSWLLNSDIKLKSLRKIFPKRWQSLAVFVIKSSCSPYPFSPEHSPNDELMVADGYWGGECMGRVSFLWE